MYNPNDALGLAILAGEIMLKNGAETYRVEDTMRRIMGNCGYKNVEAFVAATGVFACIHDNDTGAVTIIKRVKNRVNNYEKIASVNDLSRLFAEGKISMEEVSQRLKEIDLMPVASPFIRIFVSGAACFCFAFMLGGSIFDSINALFTGFLLQAFLIPLYKKNVSSVLIHILGGAIISFFALTLFNLGIGDDLNHIIIGSLMPLLPGIAFTNAIRDILEGDYLSGTTRTVDALIIAIAIATGVGMVLKIWFTLFDGIMI